jgi:hypothetical protein
LAAFCAAQYNGQGLTLSSHYRECRKRFGEKVVQNTYFAVVLSTELLRVFDGRLLQPRPYKHEFPQSNRNINAAFAGLKRLSQNG